MSAKRCPGGTAARVAGRIVACTALCAAVLAGCADTECDPCTGDDPCPDFVGAYYGQLDDMYCDCDHCNVVRCDPNMQVLSQRNDEDNEQTELLIEKRDEYGSLASYTGYLCNTSDDGEKKAYPFQVTRSDEAPGQNAESKYYTVNGNFVVENDVILEVRARERVEFMSSRDNDTCNLECMFTAVPGM